MRRSVKLRELREQKQMAANAALNSLSLGPPIQLKRDVSFFNYFETPVDFLMLSFVFFVL